MSIPTVKNLISTPEFLSRVSTLGRSAVEKCESDFLVYIGGESTRITDITTNRAVGYVCKDFSGQSCPSSVHIHNHPISGNGIFDCFSDRDLRINNPEQILGLVSVFSVFSLEDKFFLRLLLAQFRDQQFMTSFNYSFLTQIYESYLIKNLSYLRGNTNLDTHLLCSSRIIVDSLIDAGMRACAVTYNFDPVNMTTGDIKHIIGEIDSFKLSKIKEPDTITDSVQEVTSPLQAIEKSMWPDIEKGIQELRGRLHQEGLTDDQIEVALESIRQRYQFSFFLLSLSLKTPFTVCWKLAEILMQNELTDIQELYTNHDLKILLQVGKETIQEFVDKGSLRPIASIESESVMYHCFLQKPKETKLDVMCKNAASRPHLSLNYSPAGLNITFAATDKNNEMPMYCIMSFIDFLKLNPMLFDMDQLRTIFENTTENDKQLLQIVNTVFDQIFETLRSAK